MRYATIVNIKSRGPFHSRRPASHDVESGHWRAHGPCRFVFCLLPIFLTALSLPACNFRHFDFWEDPNTAVYQNLANQPIVPEGEGPQDPITGPPPRTIRQGVEPEFWNLRLEEAFQIGLANSEVMRDLGGRLISSPSAVNSIYDPAIAVTNPQFGVEAALAQFDPVWTINQFWNRVDQPQNVQSVFGFVNIAQQENSSFQTQIAKTAATGAQFALRNNTDYNGTNSPIARFPSAWATNVEAEVRQPLLQGAGVNFNRIAGPNAQPGNIFTNGVVLARLNADMTLADFENGVVTYLSQVEEAYWELLYAYRALDTALAARDAALETWRRVFALYQVGRVGGEAENEAQARAQFFAFQAAVQDALAGTATTPGVYASERRLRLLLGLPPSDDRLIRPTDDPIMAEVVFDWSQLVNQAMVERIELRRQRIEIRSREMQMVAARNFLLPQLDAVALYRWRGFGDDLLGPGDPGSAPFSSAFGTLFDGRFEDWQLGFQFTMPLGLRRAMANMRNVRLQLAREQAILREQELTVAHQLSSALADADRAFVLMQTNLNRRRAAQEQVQAVQAAFEVGRATLDLLVRAQQLRAEAELAFYRSVVDYAIALKNVQLAKGTLLVYDGVALAESPWPKKAYEDAARIAHWDRISYVFTRPHRAPPNEACATPGSPMALGAAGTPHLAPETIPAPAEESPYTPGAPPPPPAELPPPAGPGLPVPELTSLPPVNQSAMHGFAPTPAFSPPNAHSASSRSAGIRVAALPARQDAPVFLPPP